MLKLLETTGIPADGAATSLASCPGRPFFLDPVFIEKHWQPAELPAEKLMQTIAFAERIQNEPRYRHLAWHLYRYLTQTPFSSVQADKLPDIIEGLGIESGMFYILVALSLIPGFISRAEREGFPRRYGEAGAKRIGSTTCFFAQLHNGEFGLRGRNLLFFLHYMKTATWRIGRFDFVIQKADDAIPEIYRRGDEVIALCADGVPLDHNGDRSKDAESSARVARFSSDGSCVTGLPIDLATGLAGEQEITLDSNDGWERVAGPGDWTLFFHIPGGGGMTPELCEASFAEAIGFFRDYVPEKNFRLIWSVSWIFNPAWVKLIPASNMAALIKRGRLFPGYAFTNPGMYFVFGKDDGKLSEFKAVNSLERAVLKCFKEKSLRRTGWFIFTDEI